MENEVVLNNEVERRWGAVVGPPTGNFRECTAIMFKRIESPSQLQQMSGPLNLKFSYNHLSTSTRLIAL
jgi:hypothetical protein